MSQPSFDPGYLSAVFADLGSVFERSRAVGETLRETEYRGTSADEDVVATVTGFGLLRKVHISTMAKRRLDSLTLAEHVVQAINRAMDAAEEGRTELLASIQVNGTSATQVLADIKRGEWPRVS
jgi:DNA-binding protein YbaB